MWKNEKKYFYRKNISSNHLFSKFFSKYVAFTKFLPKMCGRGNFRNLLSPIFSKKFVKATFY